MLMGGLFSIRGRHCNRIIVSAKRTRIAAAEGFAIMRWITTG